MLLQPGCTAVGLLQQALGGDVVGSQGQLLVLVVAVEVVVGQVGELLGLDDLPHQLHSGVVLSAVLAFLGIDGHLLQRQLVGAQGDVQLAALLLGDGELLRLVAHGAEGESPALMAVDAELAVDVADDCHAVPLVDDTGVWHTLAGLTVDDASCQLLCQHGHSEQSCQQGCNDSSQHQLFII